MKYMGSKEWMLGNSLGHILDENIQDKTRFVDLFAGAGSVSWRMAEKHTLPVVAVDLQRYSKVLCEAVIARTTPASPDALEDWLQESAKLLHESRAHGLLSAEYHGDSASVANARTFCDDASGVISSAYGGHYFSPRQALAFDCLLAALPNGAPRSTLLAALLTAATRCAAATGHLAQPLQPSSRTEHYISNYWKKDVFAATRKAYLEIAPRHARAKGRAQVGDAHAFVGKLGPQDLVFIDPPYTGVHYSRFYHVLETMVRGSAGPISGRGRYPPADERPRSDYSTATTSKAAVENLLAGIAGQRATAIMTFPAGVCSNGLSGMFVRNAARRYFEVEQHAVQSRFSTLGGRKGDRNPRKIRKELVLLLRPK